jgi:hypothetical protein
LAERNISPKNWRCPKCLVKNLVAIVGWECSGCHVPCEEDRIRAREKGALEKGLTAEDASSAIMEEATHYTVPNIYNCATCYDIGWVGNGFGEWIPCTSCQSSADSSYVYASTQYQIPSSADPWQGSHQSLSSPTAVPEQAIPEQAVPEQTVPEQTVPEQAVPEHAIPEQTVSEQTVPEHAIPEQTVPEQTVPEQAVPEHAIPEQTIPEQTVPEQAVPEHAIPEQTIPEQTVPEQAVLEQTVPEQAVPEHAIPEQTVPEQAVPEHAIPEQAVPEQAVPEHAIQVVPKKSLKIWKNPFKILCWRIT